jgi:phosphate-selective porin
MKKISVFFVALALVASVASAQGPTVKTRSTTAKATTHPVSAEIVSTDAAAKTITLKVGDKSVTMPVQGKAIAELSTFKAGDQVTATCKDDAKGQHEAITNIKTAKAAKIKIKK